MKVLWITNPILPRACEYLNRQPSVSGGWLSGFLDALSGLKQLQLCVVTVYDGKELLSFHAEGVAYYLIPKKRPSTAYDRSLEKHYRTICDTFQPEVIHIHGTEYNFGQACMNACPEFRYVVSIQGLVSVIERYAFAGMDIKEIWRNITFRDVVRRETIFQTRRQLRKRGIYERQYISRVHHVIGRTYWDEVHSKAINRKINYHFCNDNLQKEFYNTSRRWNLQSIEKYSVYMSQGFFPIKGLHILLKAAHIVRQKHPSLKIYVAGYSPVKSNSIRDRITTTGYGKYIRGLIKKLALEEVVVFTGPLTVDGVINRLLKSHVCVFPSSIENGSSLGEAQYLGTPGIVSYAGGMPTTVRDEETGLMYRFEEYEMLADLLDRVFSDRQLAEKLSKAGMVVSSQRHSGAANAESLLSIYNRIIQLNA
ncbi:MAG: glycosyltransferase family 4 protein [Bacteroidota bacterium]